MSVRILSKTGIAGAFLTYLLDDESGMVEMNFAPREAERCSMPQPAEMTPLVFLKFAEDFPAGFGGGRSCRYTGTPSRFRFISQERGFREIITTLADDVGCKLIHRVGWNDGLSVIACQVTLQNDSVSTIGVELLESFTLGGILAGQPDKTVAEAKIHRFRSHWCNEAYHEERFLPELLLERRAAKVAAKNERYGQIGTLPVRGFHPFGALEDTVNGICWGAQLAWSGSWQMEFSMWRAGTLEFGGGLADFEFGHWRKNLSPGESLSAPTAYIGCVKGSFDELCAHLVRTVEKTLQFPASEEDLPVLFNEWCTSWGEPSAASLTAIAEKLQLLPVKYLVIDAGWYKKDGTDWACGQGDWHVNQRLYPGGIDETIEKIKSCGLLPGIWFEAEVAGNSAEAYNAEAGHFLKKDGKVITAGTRRFWDHNDPAARKILQQRVIDFLHDHGFGYVKIDYNETFGIGCDHPDSPGEGLRQQVLGTHRFFKRLAECNPGLVIENCASGGHRLEPAMLALSSMSSFSDAHEGVIIPVIAASLHRLIPVRCNQIWAVLRKNDTLQRVAYTMSAAMLGRICLSGDILELSPEQWELMKQGLEFFRRLVPVLKDGDSLYLPQFGTSRVLLNGGQLLVRSSSDGRRVILYFHVFNDPPETMEYVLPFANGSMEIYQAENTGTIQLSGSHLRLSKPSAFSGHVVSITKEN